MASEQDHLRRLVFEVYGQEEAIRKLEEINQAEEKRKKSIRGLVREAKKAAKEEARAARDSARAQEQAAEKIKQANEKTAQSAQMAARVGAVAFAALAKAALEAKADLEESDGRLQRSFKRTGASAIDYAETMATVDARARELGLGIIGQRDALSDLIDATGNHTEALEQLALANDIAATGDADLKEAVQLLTQARKGEIEELKKLDGFNKDTIEAMQLMENNTERAAEAVRILKENYDGAAGTLKGTKEDMANLEEAVTDLLVGFGDATTGLISATLQWFGILEEKEGVMEATTRGFREWASEVKRFGQNLTPGDLIDMAKGGGILTQGGRDAFFNVFDRGYNNEAMGNSPTGGSYTENTKDVPVGPVAPPDEGGFEFSVEESKKVADEAEKARDRAIKAAEERERRYQELWEAQAARLQEERELIKKKAEEAEKAAEREIEAAERKAEAQRRDDEANAALYAKIAADEEKRKQKQKKDADDLAQTEAEATRTKVDAAMAGADALGGVAKQFARTQGEAAAIEAGLATLRAGVAFAMALTPPPLGGPQYMPGAIAQAGAAAALAAKAAQLGASGGGASGGGGGATRGRGVTKGSGGKVGKNAMSTAREDNELATRPRADNRGSSALVVNFHSAVTPTPEQARTLADAVASEMRNR